MCACARVCVCVLASGQSWPRVPVGVYFKGATHPSPESTCSLLKLALITQGVEGPLLKTSSSQRTFCQGPAMAQAQEFHRNTQTNLHNFHLQPLLTIMAPGHTSSCAVKLLRFQAPDIQLVYPAPIPFVATINKRDCCCLLKNEPQKRKFDEFPELTH